MAATGAENSEEKLSEIFENGFQIYYSLDTSTASSNSADFQIEVKKGIAQLEKATHIVNELSVFSSNEQIEEVATADLKYLLLPAILGSLTLKLVGDNRLEILEAAEIYFQDYLERLKLHGIPVPRAEHGMNGEDEGGSSETRDENKKAQKVIPPEVEAMVRKRNDKINRYRQQREFEAKRLELKKRMEQDNVEDETAREYYMVLFRIWISIAIEELQSIEMEKPILAHMQNLKIEGKPKLPPPPKTPLKPVIIAKNQLQKQVFGIGYPSIPTMTVDEFYEQRYGEHAEEHAPAALSLQKMAANPEEDALEREQEDKEKEALEEKDDDTAIAKAREWDDWKDDHRRGFGNRKNMG